MATIFISYASEDLTRVRPLVAELERRGWSVWWDRELVVGPSYDQKIEQALDTARCVVVVWSRYSIGSRWVRAEANEGLERDILVPILIDDVKPPLVFRTAQTARMVDWPAERGELDEAMDGIGQLLGATAEPQPAAAKTIAVLPFSNLSQDPEQEFFCEGVAEDILNGLARNPGISVIARTSSFKFKDLHEDVRLIGSQLGATHLLEGSLRKAADRIRITVQLVAADTGVQLWSERYDRDLTDVFELQDEITGVILEQLDLVLTGTRKVRPEASRNVDAYDAYLIGRHHLHRLEPDDALIHFRRAIEADPQSAAARGSAAFTIFYGIGQRHYTPDRYPEILTEAEKALAIDPLEPHAFTAMAAHRFFVQRQYQAAIDELAELQRQVPSHIDVLNVMGYMLRVLKKDALEEQVRTRMLALDPLNPLVHTNIGIQRQYVGDYEAARSAYDRAGALGADAQFSFSWLAFEADDHAEIRRRADAWSVPEGHLNESLDLMVKARRHQLDGDDEAFGAALRRLEDAEMAYIAASLASDWQRAVELFKADMAAGWWWEMVESAHGSAGSRQRFAGFYAEPAFRAFRSELGLDADSLDRIHLPSLNLG